MSLLHFRCKERRRTLRVALTVPLTIHGKTDIGEKFSAQTHSQSVNRHGALFQLEEIVLVGQTLILMNDHTAQSMECHVVSIHRALARSRCAGSFPTKSPRKAGSGIAAPLSG